MLGDSGGPQSTYDFHGEEAVAGAPLFSSQYASPYVINGSKWINGTQQSAGSLLSRYTSPTIQIIQTTDFVRASNFGDRDVANRYFLGSYAELILVGSILTSSDLQKIEGYLAHKWGLTAGLPASHPYKSAAPTVPSLP
jgi:hypothetical protein